MATYPTCRKCGGRLQKPKYCDHCGPQPNYSAGPDRPEVASARAFLKDFLLAEMSATDASAGSIHNAALIGALLFEKRLKKMGIPTHDVRGQTLSLLREVLPSFNSLN